MQNLTNQNFKRRLSNTYIFMSRNVVWWLSMVSLTSSSDIFYENKAISEKK
jgi:hypothetical protein